MQKLLVGVAGGHSTPTEELSEDELVKVHLLACVLVLLLAPCRLPLLNFFVRAESVVTLSALLVHQSRIGVRDFVEHLLGT